MANNDTTSSKCFLYLGTTSWQWPDIIIFMQQSMMICLAPSLSLCISLNTSISMAQVKYFGWLWVRNRYKRTISRDFKRYFPPTSSCTFNLRTKGSFILAAILCHNAMGYCVSVVTGILLSLQKCDSLLQKMQLVWINLIKRWNNLQNMKLILTCHFQNGTCLACCANTDEGGLLPLCAIDTSLKL